MNLLELSEREALLKRRQDGVERNEVVLLFNVTPFAPDPWARRGFTVHCYDLLTKEERREIVGNGVVVYHPWDSDLPGALDELVATHPHPWFVGGFPPCTDLSVAGNGWRKRKEEANPRYLDDAMARLHFVKAYADAVGAPYFIENPVGKASTLWRKPDHKFIPADYGGYLPEDDVHPVWPDKIPPNDAYSKKTLLWTGNGFIMPKRKPVPIVTSQITCSYWFKDLDEEKIYRSATPRGFCEAVADANS